MSEQVALLVPVKRWDRAKSRLVHDPAPVVDDPRSLAEAFARDAIAAALDSASVGSVQVVTDQPGFAPPGTSVLPDEGGGDLNRALARAAARVRATDPRATVGTMFADLPCLRADDLTTALRSAAAHDGRCYVADAAGTGTTLLVAAPGHDLDPHFGAGSADLHRRSGARAIEAAVPTLRLDVDTAGDLAVALRVGVGPHTEAALAGRRP